VKPWVTLETEAGVKPVSVRYVQNLCDVLQRNAGYKAVSAVRRHLYGGGSFRASRQETSESCRCSRNILSWLWLRVSIAMDYRLDGLDSIPGSTRFFFSTVSRLILGTTQPPTQWVLVTLPPGVKQRECIVDHSPPSSDKVKRSGAIPSSPICLLGTVLT
jgi:hypothetical protein